MSPGLPERPLKRGDLRRRIKSSRCYWRIKLFLKRISGRELWLRRQIHLPTRGETDWRYDPSRLDRASVVYSFGVGDDIAFETALIEYHGLTVHAFDPTPYARAWIEGRQFSSRLAFHPWAVSGRDGRLELYPRVNTKGRRSKTMWTSDPAQADDGLGIEVPAYSVASLMRMLGHSRIDLMKMDIEGAEYESLDAMLADRILPRQLLVEFHHRFPGIGKHRTRASIKRLQAAGYRIFSISPTGREIGFVSPP
jgi:FkbM family methyltransferase